MGVFSPHQTSIWGHRGWPARFPENSLEGLRAVAAVADGAEVDIRRAADGELVLAHDPDVSGLAVHATPSAVLSEAGIATLAEALAVAAGLPLDLEVKNHPLDPGFEPDHRIALEVAALARPGDLVTCFHWPSMDVIRDRHPEVATGLLVGEGGSLEEAVRWAVEKGHPAVAPHHSLLNEQSVEAAREQGLAVVAWTVNDPQRAAELAAWGVEAIITDDPPRLAAVG